MWCKSFLPIHPGQVEQTKWKNAIGAGVAGNTATGQFCLKCQAWRGQLGLEPYFFQYIEHLCHVFDEVKRVLKPSGTLWVNLGDAYASLLRSGRSESPGVGAKQKMPPVRTAVKWKAGTGSKFEWELLGGLRQKSLRQIPNRCALAMTDRGWVLRNEIIWHKPNCMPSSARDRFTVDFEKLFFFSKNKKYYFEPQYESLQESSIERNKYAWNSFCGSVSLIHFKRY